MSQPKTCSKKCVKELMDKAKAQFPGADFWIPSGAVTMFSADDSSRYIGWPLLRFRAPGLKKDGKPAKGKFERSYFALTYCPICGGKL